MESNRKSVIKKQPTGFGIFVRNDVNGRPVYIGDTVKIFTPAQTISQDAEEIGTYNTDVEEHTMTGTLILRLSKGLMLRTGVQGHYNYWKISYSPYCSRYKRIWELI